MRVRRRADSRTGSVSDPVNLHSARHARHDLQPTDWYQNTPVVTNLAFANPATMARKRRRDPACKKRDHRKYDRAILAYSRRTRTRDQIGILTIDAAEKLTLQGRMFDSITPDDLAYQLPADAYYQLVRTLRLTLPPPLTDSAEDLRRRDHAAIAAIAALAPANAAEAGLAASFVAASEQWKDCLRLVHASETTPSGRRNAAPRRPA